MHYLNKRQLVTSSLIVVGVLVLVGFQNCSKVNFAEQTKMSSVDGAAGVSGEPAPASPPSIGDLPVCSGVSCDLTSLTQKAAVTTILMALGDELNDQLIVNGSSAQFIAESVVRYSSPKDNPKILLVHDVNSQSESPHDYAYAAKLLSRYSVTEVNEPASGMKLSDFDGYDIVWINNPGYPLGTKATHDALLAFKGGVVLQGDDMAWSRDGFSNTDLTGLKFIDNGTSVVCSDGKSYNHDGGGYQYRVSLTSLAATSTDASIDDFRYGNDIDNTTPARADLEILATAKGGPEVCTASRPVIVRYTKDI